MHIIRKTLRASGSPLVDAKRTIAARVGIALQPAETSPTPTDTELAAFVAGTLAAERSRQVRAHIARDPKVFERWVPLTESALARRPTRANP